MKTFCISCDQVTNHKVHAEYIPLPLKDLETGITENNEYYILQCLGCDHIGMLRKWWNDDGLEKEEKPYVFEDRLPEDPNRFYDYEFLRDEDQDHLPSIIYDAYEELKIAMYSEADVLAGVAIRMIVEATCLHQKSKENI